MKLYESDSSFFSYKLVLNKTAALGNLNKVREARVSTARLGRRLAMPLDNVLTQKLHKRLNVKLKRRRKSLVPRHLHTKPRQQRRSIDWLGFNGTFSTNKLYRAFDKYVAIKKVKLMTEFTTLHVGNTYT